MSFRDRRTWILPLLIVIVIFVAYFYGWEIETQFHKNDVAYSMPELANLVSRDIDEGKQHSVLYVKNVKESEIQDINNVMCNLNGSVKSFTVITSGKTGLKIKLDYEISDTFYVIEKYKRGAKIPNDRPTAEKLYNVVDEIIKTTVSSNMSDYEKELALHDYIVLHSSYGYETGAEKYAYTAYGVLCDGKGVCSGYAQAFSLLLTCCGIENEFVTGEAGGESHAWNKVKLDGNWYSVDITWDDPVPDRLGYAGHQYFNVTDDLLDDDHEWDDATLPDATSETLNYFVKNNLICDYEQFKINVVRAGNMNNHGTFEIVVKDYDENKYNMDFLTGVSGLEYYMMSHYPYGGKEIITIYFNQK